MVTRDRQAALVEQLEAISTHANTEIADKLQ
jgi:hypothetical protein